MGIGISIFLLAAGAVLAFAVETTAEGVDLDAIGVILMIVGGIGLLFSALFWSDWAPYRRDRGVARPADREVVREREYV